MKHTNQAVREQVKERFNSEIKRWKNGKIPYSAVALIREDVLVLLGEQDKELREKRRVLDENFPSWKEPTNTLAYGARGTIIQIDEVLGEVAKEAQ